MDHYLLKLMNLSTYWFIHHWDFSTPSISRRPTGTPEENKLLLNVCGKFKIWCYIMTMRGFHMTISTFVQILQVKQIFFHSIIIFVRFFLNFKSVSSIYNPWKIMCLKILQSEVEIRKILVTVIFLMILFANNDVSPAIIVVFYLIFGTRPNYCKFCHIFLPTNWMEKITNLIQFLLKNNLWEKITAIWTERYNRNLFYYFLSDIFFYWLIEWKKSQILIQFLIKNNLWRK